MEICFLKDAPHASVPVVLRTTLRNTAVTMILSCCRGSKGPEMGVDRCKEQRAVRFILTVEVSLHKTRG